ncbi:hypothetical protein E1B28_009205 [Marasmius oreades]|uniref:Uncharacterized protein n=1 Tax=Marasmius oreades TaxID=181124 RepID=A0A9P7USX8_9AGAR|nr:uncharacterized protein E1B28_009205 [Marasmius oreades]KAG7092898.1 hypothetical protein E1B28_009205 [Marasmius oreades]
MSTFTVIYEFVLALVGCVFSSWLIYQIIFADTRMTEEERLARRARRRELHGLKPLRPKSKVKRTPHGDEHIKAKKSVIFTTETPQSSTLKFASNMPTMMKTLSNKIVREASRGWLVKEVIVNDEMMAMSRALSSNPAVCTGW